MKGGVTFNSAVTAALLGVDNTVFAAAGIRTGTAVRHHTNSKARRSQS